MYVFLCLTSFNIRFSKSIHVATNGKILFFLLLLSSIPVGISVCMCSHIFIYSSLDGHLGCFYNLAIINNAAMNTEAHISFN